METSVKKIGNSAGVVIPKPMLQEIGAEAGDKISLLVVDGRIVLEPLPKSARAGWAEAAERLAQDGDADPVWPDFPNDDDKNWTW